MDRIGRSNMELQQTARAVAFAIAEPPFAHIRHVMGLNRFSHRGKHKVNTQWNLFCTLHNMKKIHRYAEGFS